MPDHSGAFANLVKSLSTETLESMLRDMTLSEGELDMEQVDCILAELDHRQGKPDLMDPQEALVEFEADYAGTESAYLDCAHEEAPAETAPAKRKRPWTRIFLVAAAITVLTVGSLVAVQAIRPEGLGATAFWTHGQLGFSQQMASNAEAERIAEENAVWPPTPDEDPSVLEDFVYATDSDVLEKYGTFAALLDAYHVAPEIYAPSYMPEGFELIELDRVPWGPWMKFYALYRNEEGQTLSIHFLSYESTPYLVYEKADDSVQIIDIDDHSFHVFSNSNRETVTWITEHFECSAVGTISRDELIKIVESIYVDAD